ncbi:MAG: hypothetical protein ABIH23_00885 [bacterium]
MTQGHPRLPNTPDLSTLRDLHFCQGWRITSISLDIMAGRSSVELEKDGKTRRIESEEPELLFTLGSFKEGYDRDGKARFERVHTDAYYDDMEFFIDEDNRRLRAAVDSIRNRKTPIDTPTAVGAITRLVFEQDYSPTILALIRNRYFDVMAHAIVWMKENHDSTKKLQAKLPESRRISESVEKHLLNRLLPPFQSNPLKTIRDFYSIIDLDHEAARITEQKQYYSALMGILSEKGSLPGPDGARFLSDIYRRFAELSRPFIKGLISFEPSADAGASSKLSYEDEVALVRKMGLADLVRHLEPKVRNSEAHVSTRIIESERAILFQSSQGSTKKSFQRIAEMTTALTQAVVPGLLTAFQMTRLCLIPMLLRTAKFKLHLVVECQKLRRTNGAD